MQDNVPAECQKFADEKEASFVAHSYITGYANYTYDEVCVYVLCACLCVQCLFMSGLLLCQ